MSIRLKTISDETLDWLLDPSDPGARYLALLRLGDSLSGLRETEGERAHQRGPIKTILEALHPEGYWISDGPGYLPKYRSTVWSLILLSQLGASIKYAPRIKTACQNYLDRSLTEHGQISSSGSPSGTADCLQGNMLSALVDLGCTDSRLSSAFEWMARSVTGEGVAPMQDKKAHLRYYSGKVGPDFQCGSNNKQACAWGAAKVMLAFSKLDPTGRTPLIEKAIQRGFDFLFSSDLAEAGYPSGWSANPSGNWWKFGFPVFYVTDILQICEALVRLGYAEDTRLNNALALIHNKQTSDGRWVLEYDYSGKTWGDFGRKKEPNKWVTIRALFTLGHKIPTQAISD